MTGTKTEATAAPGAGWKKATVTKKGDGWLSKLGINVSRLRQAAPDMPPLPPIPDAKAVPPAPGVNTMPPLPPIPAKVTLPAARAPAVTMPTLPQTPDEIAYRAALQAAKPILDAAGQAIFVLTRGGEVDKLKSSYNAASVAAADAQARGDYRAAANMLKKRVDAAELIVAADKYERPGTDSMTNRRMHAAIQLAAANLAQSSNAFAGQKDINASFVEAKKKVDAALGRQDYASAAGLFGDLIGYAHSVNEPYKLLMQADQNQPLFERAEKIFKSNRRSSTLSEMQKTYAIHVKNQNQARETSNYEALETALKQRITEAKKAIRYSKSAEIDEWFEAGTKSPDEAGKFAAVAKLQGVTAKSIKEGVRKSYQDALVDGVKLNLSPAQSAAVAGYSGAAFTVMNNLLRGSLTPEQLSNPDLLEAAEVQIALLKEALDKLPTYSPGAFPLFRWEQPFGDFLETRYSKIGTPFQIKEFWSTGAGGGSNVGGNSTTEILVWGKKNSSAKDIARLSAMNNTSGRKEGGRGDESKLKGQGSGEVLFPPGTWFEPLVFTKLSERPLTRVDSLTDKEAELNYRVEVVEIERR